jgi:large subunit ribosomal protein L24
LHISNVALLDPKTRKASRLGFKMEGDKKVRVARKSGQTV